jgi:hypothetical protein
MITIRNLEKIIGESVEYTYEEFEIEAVNPIGTDNTYEFLLTDAPFSTKIILQISREPETISGITNALRCRMIMNGKTINSFFLKTEVLSSIDRFKTAIKHIVA